MCFQQHLESVGVVAMMSEVVVQEHTGEEFLQVFQHRTLKDMILCSIRCLTGNQCSSFRKGVMFSLFRVQVTVLAAVF